MKNKNGYSSIELIILIVALGVISITVFTKMSYAFENDEEGAYETKINMILKDAELYALKNKEELEKKEEIFVTVKELVEQNYITNAVDKEVIDPRDNKKTLNHMKVKITFEDDEIKTEMVE